MFGVAGVVVLGLFEDGAHFVVAVEGAEGGGEAEGDAGVLGGELEGEAEVVDGFFVFLLLHEGHAEEVEGEDVFGGEFDGGAEGLFGFVDFVLVVVDDGEVGPGVEEAGVFLEHAAVAGGGLVVFFFGEEVAGSLGDDFHVAGEFGLGLVVVGCGGGSGRGRRGGLGRLLGVEGQGEEEAEEGEFFEAI